MSEQAIAEPQTIEPGQAEPVELAERTWVTPLVCGLCIGVFLLLTQDSSGEELAHRLLPSGADVWTGRYWGLLSSVIVHFDIIHLGANLYWLWTLGRLI